MIEFRFKPKILCPAQKGWKHNHPEPAVMDYSMLYTFMITNKLGAESNGEYKVYIIYYYRHFFFLARYLLTATRIRNTVDPVLYPNQVQNCVHSLIFSNYTI